MEPAFWRSKDVLSGLLFASIGIAFFWIGSGYRLGVASRMGPGYFPRALAVLLIVVGLSILAKALLKGSPDIGHFAWKPLSAVVASTVAFALLLPTLGLVVALVVLVLGGAAASMHFALTWKSVLGLAFFVTTCVAIFVYALSVPLPIFGTWITPYISH